MTRRLPLILSTVALCVAIVGTPVSEGALHAVRLALFANNAGAVNGIKAFRAPHASQLLALNAHGRFPSSVLAIPTGQQGPQGSQGPQGPTGTEGPAGVSHLYGAFTGETTIGTTQTRLDIATLPAGKYLVIGYANLSDLDTVGASGICDLHVVGRPPLEDDDEDYYSLAPAGIAPWRKRLVLYLLHDFGPAGGQVEMTCHNDSPAYIRADWVTIAALQADSLTLNYIPASP